MLDTKTSKKRRFSDDTIGHPLSGFNWDLCIFCQSSKKDKLECPATFQRVSYNTYKKLATNTKCFKERKACLISLSIPEMQDVLLQELLSNESAKFHRSYKNKFSDLKLGHVEKQQKMSLEKRQNEISSNDSDVTPGNLEMSFSSKSSVLTRQHSNEKNEVAKEQFFLRW